MRAGSNPLPVSGLAAGRPAADARVSVITTVRGVPRSSQPAPSPTAIAAAPPRAAQPTANAASPSGRMRATLSSGLLSAQQTQVSGELRHAVFTCFFPTGQAKHQDRLPRHGVELERAAHQLGELPRDRQAEAAAGGLCPVDAVEALEDVRRSEE